MDWNRGETVYSREQVYARYLQWFGEWAAEGMVPQKLEEILSVENQDLFENEDCVINALCYVAPLLNEETVDGQLHLFLFREINFMKKEKASRGDLVEALPVTYRYQLL